MEILVERQHTATVGTARGQVGTEKETKGRNKERRETDGGAHGGRERENKENAVWSSGEHRRRDNGGEGGQDS